MEQGVIAALVLTSATLGALLGVVGMFYWANVVNERSKWRDSGLNRATREFNRNSFDTMLREVHTHMLSDWELTEDAYHSIVSLHFSNGYTIELRSRPVGFQSCTLTVPDTALSDQQLVKAPGNLTGMMSSRDARSLEELTVHVTGKDGSNNHG